ncbi:MAG: alkaline phosphatase [Wenzhouxiangella sp.]|nr:MAG: alkaline phosphatase [Wenzhouxiangella sp.]
MAALLFWGLVVNFLLVAPLWLRFGTTDGRWLAWEAWLLVGAFALLPDRAPFRFGRWLLVGVLLAALILGFGDGATHQVLSRPLNVYLDIILVSAGFNLLDGNLGRAGALAVTATVIVLLAGLTVLLALALRPGRVRTVPALMLAALLTTGSLAMAALEIGGQRPLAVARTPVWDTLTFQLSQVRETHQARAEFEAASPPQERPATAMRGLADTDVLLVFVESYGVTVFDQERYRKIVQPALERMAPRLEQAGLSVVSGLLEAPVRGGQSWLAHATALSGRWIDNQLWYRLLLDSHRNTLIDDFRATGHDTLAVVPAITMAWPEGTQLGYDRIFAARDLGYAGPPLNWVTMPDQYTLHHFQSVLRPAAARPLFAKIALISSHAPWTPVIEVLPDWESIGDGSVFERWRNAGDPPQVLWQDIERVRDHFALSVEYSMEVSLDYAARFLGDDSLLILLGDHQPAALITGHEASAAVPVHVISANPELVEPFRQRGFVDGLIPDYPGTAPPMDQLRDWLHEDFGH